jgi:hypothetical protein
MAKVTVTPFTPEHLAGVRALYAKTFGAVALRHFDERSRWSRTTNLAPAETFSWVLEGEGTSVLGYLVALPIPYRVAGQRLWAWTTADFMVDPSASFHGFSLLREAFKRCPRQVSLDDVPATKALLGVMKAKPAGDLVRWAKALDAVLLKREHPLASRVPDAVFSASRPLLRLVDRLRRPRGLPSVVEVPFDERFDRFAAAHCGLTGASVYRDLAWYRWRYGPGAPQRVVRALAVLSPESEIEAYTIVATQSTATPRAAYVLELCGPPSTSLASWQALLVGAIRAARGTGAQVLYAPVLEGSSAIERALASVDFLRRAHRLTLFVRPSPTDAHPLAAQLLDGPWNIQYGDAEQSHGAVT